MLATVAVAALALCAVSTDDGSANKDSIDRDSTLVLREGARVFVGLNQKAKDVGADDEAIRTQVEVALRKCGIRVVEREVDLDRRVSMRSDPFRSKPEFRQAWT
jgi:hypothetical protein